MADRVPVPLARARWILYDRAMGFTQVPTAYDTVLARVQPRPGQRVLDIGCGSGNLLLKVAHFGADSFGLDPDVEALRRLQRRAAAEQVTVHTMVGEAHRLPYPDQAFDYVLSALVFHHVATDQRVAMLDEISRVLKTTGSVHIVDLSGRPEAGRHRGLRQWFVHRHAGNNDIQPQLDAAGWTTMTMEPLRTRLGPLQHVVGTTQDPSRSREKG